MSGLGKWGGADSREEDRTIKTPGVWEIGRAQLDQTLVGGRRVGHLGLDGYLTLKGRVPRIGLCSTAKASILMMEHM